MTTEFIQQYLDLLIFQYQGLPRAEAEINFMASQGERVYELLHDYRAALDIDTAIGHQLDVLGRILGFSRQVEEVLEKVRFGFANNDNSKGFADRFNPLRPSAPFFDRFELEYTNLQLGDSDYRLFLRVIVARNTGSAYIVDDERISIQDAVEVAFGVGNAWVVDKQDMTLVVNISPKIDTTRAKAIARAGILPHPQGVSFRFIIQADPTETFGFASNPNSNTFADRFGSTREGGIFARRLKNV